MKILIPILCLFVLSGCAGLRVTNVTAKVKDAKYVAAEGSGNALYKSVTCWSFLHNFPTQCKTK